jgi:predicted dehydrogenase
MAGGRGPPTVNPVRCAVVGLGMIGSVHAAVLHEHPLADLVAACDLDPATRKAAPGGVPFVDSPERLFDEFELEAVFICTPQARHREIVEIALRHGLVVFCEKPIAHDLDDADAIIAAAERGPGRLVIGHTLRFDPAYAQLADAIAAGDIGEVVSIAARRNVPSFEGRVIASRTTLATEIAVHDLDVARWIAGDIVRVHAEQSRRGIVGEGFVDAIVATIRFAGGAVGVMDFNWTMSAESGVASDHRFAAFGSDGSAYADSRTPSVAIFSTTATSFFRTDWLAELYGVYAGVLHTEDEYFLRTIRENLEWPISLGDARAALDAALALDRSVATGEPVNVSTPPDPAPAVAN